MAFPDYAPDGHGLGHGEEEGQPGVGREDIGAPGQRAPGKAVGVNGPGLGGKVVLGRHGVHYGLLVVVEAGEEQVVQFRPEDGSVARMDLRDQVDLEVYRRGDQVPQGRERRTAVVGSGNGDLDPVVAGQVPPDGELAGVPLVKGRLASAMPFVSLMLTEPVAAFVVSNRKWIENVMTMGLIPGFGTPREGMVIPLGRKTPAKRFAVTRFVGPAWYMGW